MYQVRGAAAAAHLVNELHREVARWSPMQAFCVAGVDAVDHRVDPDHPGHGVRMGVITSSRSARADGWSRSPYAELRHVAMPHLLDLLAVTKETVHLAVSSGDRILYIEKIFGHNQVSSPSRVGGTLHASCSALGKASSEFSTDAVVRQVGSTLQPRTPYSIAAPSVLLDELRSVRKAGVAFDREEAQLGLTCVAAPIFDASGSKAIAAVSISGPKNRFNPERFVPTIRETADRISRSAIGRCAAS